MAQGFCPVHRQIHPCKWCEEYGFMREGPVSDESVQAALNKHASIYGKLTGKPETWDDMLDAIPKDRNPWAPAWYAPIEDNQPGLGHEKCADMEEFPVHVMQNGQFVRFGTIRTYLKTVSGSILEWETVMVCEPYGDFGKAPSRDR